MPDIKDRVDNQHDQQLNPFTRPQKPQRLTSAFVISLVAVAAIFLASFATVRVARAADGEDTQIQLAVANMVRPNDINSGALLLPSKRPGYYVQAPRLATSVEIDINGPIARTTVTQRFENPSKGWVEGIYVFPLPEESAVDALRMQIGDRKIEGLIKTRAKAREIYEQAKREGRKAALLEQQRPNIFTNAVANIGPGETIVVQIKYQQTIHQDAGTFSLRFPLVVAPRYNPKPIIHSVDFKNDANGNKSGWGGVVNPVPDRDKITSPVLDPEQNAKINPVSMSIRLAAGFPLGSVTSHHHTIKTIVVTDAVHRLTLENETVPADRDFELSWKAKGTTPTAALFSETVNGENYVLAFVTPPNLTKDQLTNIEKKNREIIFVIDNSGSMGGQSITQARLALETALKRLDPADRFNIIRFNDTYTDLFKGAVPADREHVDQALAYVRGLDANGGTEMLEALQIALRNTSSVDDFGNRIRQVVFITDGAIGNEQQLFDEIGAHRGQSRIFTIGIGSAPNSFFMNRAAEIGRGTFTHIGSTNQVHERMSALFKKLENPVLTGLRAVVSQGKLSEVSPDPLPDVYLGEPVILAAIATDNVGNLTLEGDYAGTPWQVTMDITQATPGTGIGKLWARRKIASLEASRSLSANLENVDKQIEATALEHHLVSRLTSLVAVDVTKSRPGETDLTTKKVPHNLPDGWEFDKIFDDQANPAPIKARTRSLRQKTFKQVAMLMAAAPSQEEAAIIAKAGRRSVTLPQTATPAERDILLGLLLLLMAMMIWITSSMWNRTASIVAASRSTIAGRHHYLLP